MCAFKIISLEKLYNLYKCVCVSWLWKWSASEDESWEKENKKKFLLGGSG